MDSLYMARALDLASLGCGLVSPNPLVGSVIVREGRIVGEGFHQFALVDHAESHALRMAGPLARGATLYCNLEPCCHQGRTRPCTDALIEAGISRVVVAISDPDPRVGGRGLELLRASGIAVEVGLMAAEAARLNEIYLKATATGRPFLHVVSGSTRGYSQTSGEATVPARLPPEWRPSPHLAQFARRYDALVLGDSTGANVAMAVDYIGLGRHRVHIIAGNAVSVDNVRCCSDFGNRPNVAFIVLPDLHAPESIPKEASAFGPSDANNGPGAWLETLIAASPDERVTSVIVLGGRVGMEAASKDADKVTFVVDPKENKDSEWNSPPGYGGSCLTEEESREANAFIELSGYPVRR